MSSYQSGFVQKILVAGGYRYRRQVVHQRGATLSRLGTAFLATEQKTRTGTLSSSSNPFLAPQADREKAAVISRCDPGAVGQEPGHTQPYSYHTVCWSPPGSGDAGVLLELLPRPKSSGVRLPWGARSGDLPGTLAGRPSLWPCPGTPSPSEGLSPPRTGGMVANSPGCRGPWGLVLGTGAAEGEKCWSCELLLPLLPPPPVAMAGDVADCCRGRPLLLRGSQREAPQVQRPASGAGALTGAASLSHKRGPLTGQAMGARGCGALQVVAAWVSAP